MHQCLCQVLGYTQALAGNVGTPWCAGGMSPHAPVFQPLRCTVGVGGTCRAWVSTELGEVGRATERDFGFIQCQKDSWRVLGRGGW